MKKMHYLLVTATVAVILTVVFYCSGTAAEMDTAQTKKMVQTEKPVKVETSSGYRL